MTTYFIPRHEAQGLPYAYLCELYLHKDALRVLKGELPVPIPFTHKGRGRPVRYITLDGIDYKESDYIATCDCLGVSIREGKIKL